MPHADPTQSQTTRQNLDDTFHWHRIRRLSRKA